MSAARPRVLLSLVSLASLVALSACAGGRARPGTTAPVPESGASSASNNAATTAPIAPAAPAPAAPAAPAPAAPAPGAPTPGAPTPAAPAPATSVDNTPWGIGSRCRADRECVIEVRDRHPSCCSCVPPYPINPAEFASLRAMSPLVECSSEQSRDCPPCATQAELATLAARCMNHECMLVRVARH